MMHSKSSQRKKPRLGLARKWDYTLSQKVKMAKEGNLLRDSAKSGCRQRKQRRC